MLTAIDHGHGGFQERRHNEHCPRCGRPNAVEPPPLTPRPCRRGGRMRPGARWLHGGWALSPRLRRSFGPRDKKESRSARRSRCIPIASLGRSARRQALRSKTKRESDEEASAPGAAWRAWDVSADGPGRARESRRIAFSSNRGNDPNVYDLWAVDPDGNSLTRLTNDQAFDLDAAWSPDGTSDRVRQHEGRRERAHLLDES